MAGFPPASSAPRKDPTPVAKQDVQPSTGKNTVASNAAKAAKMVKDAPKKDATVNGQAS